jgi:hypothetical protein
MEKEKFNYYINYFLILFLFLFVLEIKQSLYRFEFVKRSEHLLLALEYLLYFISFRY